MTLGTALGLAAGSLRRDVMRSILTTLGITVGIAAVMCTVALGEGSAGQVRRQLLEMGDSFVWIEAGGRNIGGVRTGAGASPTLVPGDRKAIAEGVPAVTACTAQADTPCDDACTFKGTVASRRDSPAGASRRRPPW